MSVFHQQTLALLGSEGERPERSIAQLLAWEERNGIVLPAAFLEWAKLDDGSLLRKYSNGDQFWFDEPEIVSTPEGTRGLRFNQENQGNFDRLVTLDQGDDPPVLFAWIGRPPWVTYAKRFSEVVFAQIFDWQYWLEFKPNESESGEITYYGEIEAESESCLASLRKQFTELPTTRLIFDNRDWTEYRFSKSSMLRLTVSVDPDRRAHIRITGRPIEAVKAFEAELKRELPPVPNG
jgi:hypothetical protein